MIFSWRIDHYEDNWTTGHTLKSTIIVHGLANRRIAGGYWDRIMGAAHDDRSDSITNCHSCRRLHRHGRAGLYRCALDARAGSIVWCGNVDWRADIAAIFPLSPVAPTRGRTVYRLGAGLRAGDSDNCSGYRSDEGELSRWGTPRARLDQSLPRRDGRLYHWRDRRIIASTAREHICCSVKPGNATGYRTHGNRQLHSTDHHHYQGLDGETGGRWQLHAHHSQRFLGRLKS